MVGRKTESVSSMLPVTNKELERKRIVHLKQAYLSWVLSLSGDRSDFLIVFIKFKTAPFCKLEGDDVSPS